MSRLRDLSSAGGVFAVLSVLLTWPQVIHPASIPDNVDAYFSLWRLGWIAHQLTLAPQHLFDANIFFPHTHTLAFSDAVLLEGVLAAPLIRAGVPVIYVYTLFVLGSFIACALAMYALAFALTERRFAGLIAGTMYAFAAFRFDHYFHLELLWAMWMPLAMLAIHRTIASGRRRDGILAGVLIALQTYSSIYYGILFATALVPFGIVVAAARGVSRRAAAALAYGALTAVLLLLPYARPYSAARLDVGERTEGKATLNAAGPTHYLASVPGSLVWGRLTSNLGRHEKRLFSGALALTLMLVAVWPPWSAARAAYVAMLAAAIVLSAGPPGIVFDWLRTWVPVYRGLRAPARAAEIAQLAIAVLAAIGAARVLTAIERRSPARARYAGVVMIVIVVLESVVRLPPLVAADRTAPALAAWLRQSPDDAVVAEFPMPRPAQLPLHEGVYEYSSTFHWRPLVNGYSGNYPASYVQLLHAVEGFPSPESLDALRAAGVTYVVVHGRYYDARRFAEIAAALDGMDDIVEAARFSESGSEVRVYAFTPP